MKYITISQKDKDKLLQLVVLVIAFALIFMWAKVSRLEDEIAQNAKAGDSSSCSSSGNLVVETYPEQCFPEVPVSVQDKADANNNGWNTVVESGQGLFTVSFPDGWSGILKVLDSDWFTIRGDQQPEAKSGARVDITELESYGSDTSAVLSLSAGDNFADPRGVSANYTLVNGKDNPIVGKKYTYIHEEDSLEGIGYFRFKGDRDYTYVFLLDETKQLRISYSIYGSDPRNNLATVEALIDTIKLAK